MDESKKEIKQPKTVMLKPVNIAWLKKTALERSTPENKISDSALLDQLVDEARLRAQAQETTPSPSPSKKNAPAREVALAA